MLTGKRATSDDRESRDKLIARRLLEGLSSKMIQDRLGVSWVVVNNVKERMKYEIKEMNMDELIERMEALIKGLKSGLMSHEMEDRKVQMSQVLAQMKKVDTATKKGGK